MPTTHSKKPSIVELADRIEGDIRARGLQSGDSYLGLLETKRMLGVGTDSANRALQLLAQRGLLVRKQRKGAVVANLNGHTSGCSIDRVHIVSQKDFVKKEGLFADGQILGIQSEIPEAEIVINLLPTQNDAEYVEKLVHRAIGVTGVHCFLLVSSTFVAQQIFSESGLPVVVGGSLYPSIVGLPKIDLDHHQEGSMMANHLLERGCRKFLVLMRDKSTPGEPLVLDAMMATFAQAGLGLTDVIVRHLPGNPIEVEGEVTRVLQQNKGKFGIAARSGLLAEGAEQAASNAGLKIGKDIEFVGSNFHHQQYARGVRVNYPIARANCDPEERGKMFGQLLKRLVCNEPIEDGVLPAELVYPE